MHVLITAGGTRECIDPVRFISNASSGRMGYALARAAIRRGHSVTLITAPTTQPRVTQAAVVPVESAAQMFAAVKKRFAECDCLIMAAAVSDYTPARTRRTKIKKSDAALTIRLRPTADILAWAGNHKKPAQFVVGFALEDARLRASAEKKLRDKNLDMIVANAPSTIGTQNTTIHVKTPTSQWLTLVDVTKTVAAGKIVRLIEAAASPRVRPSAGRRTSRRRRR